MFNSQSEQIILLKFTNSILSLSIWFMPGQIPASGTEVNLSCVNNAKSFYVFELLLRKLPSKCIGSFLSSELVLIFNTTTSTFKKNPVAANSCICLGRNFFFFSIKLVPQCMRTKLMAPYLDEVVFFMFPLK